MAILQPAVVVLEVRKPNAVRLPGLGNLPRLHASVAVGGWVHVLGALVGPEEDSSSSQASAHTQREAPLSGFLRAVTVIDAREPGSLAEYLLGEEGRLFGAGDVLVRVVARLGVARAVDRVALCGGEKSTE